MGGDVLRGHPAREGHRDSRHGGFETAETFLAVSKRLKPHGEAGVGAAVEGARGLCGAERAGGGREPHGGGARGALALEHRLFPEEAHQHRTDLRVAEAAHEPIAAAGGGVP